MNAALCAAAGSARITPRGLRLCMSLYALQGVVVAYFFNFNKNYLIAEGLTSTTAGRVQAAALAVLTLKFLAGPVSDRFALGRLGRRRPYIALGVCLQSLGLFGMARFAPRDELAAFASFAVLTAAGLGIYDTCCDGYLVDVTPQPDRARVQGLVWGTRFLAAMIGTLGFGFWLTNNGGVAAADRIMLFCAAIGLIPLLLISAAPEPLDPSGIASFQWRALGTLLEPRTLAVVAFGAWYGLLGFGVETNLGGFYNQVRGFDAGSDVGMLGSLRYLGRALGALALPLALRFGTRRGVIIAGIMGLALSMGAQALVDSRPSAAVAGFLFGGAHGWCDALFALLAMEVCDPRLAASTFALIMASSNLSSLGDALFSEIAALSASPLIGYPRAFIAFAAAAALALVLVPALQRAGREPDPS